MSGSLALRRRGITAANIPSLMLNLWRLHESEAKSFDDVNFTLHNTSFDNHLRFFEMKLGCQVGNGWEGKVSKLSDQFSLAHDDVIENDTPSKYTNNY